MVLLLQLLLILSLLLLSLSSDYFCYSFASINIITIIIIIIITFFCFFCYLEPIWPEGSPFGRFLTLGCCDSELVSTQAYLYNPSVQPSYECLVKNWMVNSCYGSYQL